MFDMNHYDHGWGMGGGMWILTILFWVVVIGGILFIAKGFVGSGNNTLPTPPEDSALTILEKRFARGEIDEATFKRMKKELKESAS